MIIALLAGVLIGGLGTHVVSTILRRRRPSVARIHELLDRLHQFEEIARTLHDRIEVFEVRIIAQFERIEQLATENDELRRRLNG
jgi:hypothetical protein